MPIILTPGPPTPPTPDLGPLPDAATKVYDRLAPYHAIDAANGLTLQSIVRALVEPTAAIFDVTRSDAATPGYGKALDPDTTPAAWLDWLAQFNGSKLQPGDDEATKRARIKQAAGFYRGTERAILEELQHYLTGTKRAMLVRHDGQAFRIIVGSVAAETTAASSVLDTAARTQAPAWDVVTRAVASDDELSVLEWMVDVVAHREIVDGVDTYVEDPVDSTLTTWLGDDGTLTDWLAGD